jgi:hypothetical protein
VTASVDAAVPITPTSAGYGGPARPTTYGASPTVAWSTVPSAEAPGGRAAPERPEPGTVNLASAAYGTGGSEFATIALPTDSAVENSGSLTGHILAQGWADTPAPQSGTKVAIVLAASLAFLIVVGVLVVLVAGDAMTGLVGGMFDK